MKDWEIISTNRENEITVLRREILILRIQLTKLKNEKIMNLICNIKKQYLQW